MSFIKEEKNLEAPNVYNITSYDPVELAHYLADNCVEEIPVSIDTPEDISGVGEMLSRIGNTYSYVMSLLAFAQADIRNCRRNKDKISVEDAIDRRDVLDNFVNVIKMQYQTISRMLTAKQESRNEYRMLGGDVDTKMQQ